MFRIFIFHTGNEIGFSPALSGQLTNLFDIRHLGSHISLCFRCVMTGKDQLIPLSLHIFKRSQKEEKRDTHGGFRESPLRLNAGLGAVPVWNEDAIKQRAAKLAKMATKVWAYPALEPEILERYRPKVLPATTGYTFEEHPYLQNQEVRELFEALRREILALDPVVSEEILKLYMVYKAETNFVDIVPQAKRLTLSLNMKFHDLIAPKGMCRDVTNISRW